MKPFYQLGLRFSKSQRISILLLSFVFLSFEMWAFVSKPNVNAITVANFPPELIQLQQQIDQSKSVKSYTNKSYNNTKVTYEKFDPNQLNESAWMKLGFSSKQANVILNYKKSLGGKFHSKNQLKSCFVISDEKFEDIEPYILLPNSSKYDHENTQKKYVRWQQDAPKIDYVRFNPNHYTESDWVKVGFSPKQAATIIKYKKSLGGTFTSLEQIEACFVISEQKFKEMKPYIDLPSIPKSNLIIDEKPMQKSESKANTDYVLENFNPNHYTREQWMKIGFTEKQVNTILNFKKSLGGKFLDAAALKRCYSISDEKFKEIEPYLVFE